MLRCGALEPPGGATGPGACRASGQAEDPGLQEEAGPWEEGEGARGAGQQHLREGVEHHFVLPSPTALSLPFELYLDGPHHLGSFWGMRWYTPGIRGAHSENLSIFPPAAGCSLPSPVCARPGSPPPES